MHFHLYNRANKKPTLHSQKACVKRTQACVQVNTKLVSYINNTSLCEYITSACVRQIFYTSIVLGSHNFCVGFPQVLCYCHHKFVQWRIQDFIVWGRMPSRSLLFRFTVLPYPFASLTLHSFPPLTCSEYVHQLWIALHTSVPGCCTKAAIWIHDFCL